MDSAISLFLGSAERKAALSRKHPAGNRFRTVSLRQALGAGTVGVQSGAMLEGSGTVGPVSVASGGTLLAGTSSATGILTTGNVTFNSGSTFRVALNGTTAGSSFDQLDASGTVSLGNGVVTLSVAVGFTPAIGTSFTILKNNSGKAISGTFKGLAEGGTLTVNGMTFTITYKGGSGHDVVLTRTA